MIISSAVDTLLRSTVLTSPLGHTYSPDLQVVQQGDHIGPLLFALAWHTIPEALKNLRLNCWYLEDGALILPRSLLEDVVSTIQRMDALWTFNLTYRNPPFGAPPSHSLGSNPS